MNQHGPGTPDHHVPSFSIGEESYLPPDAPSLTERALRWRERAIERAHGLARYAPVLLFLLALAISLPRITYTERYIFDEILFAYSAGQYAEGNAAAYAWDHPCSTFKSEEGCLAANPDALQEGGRVGKYQWDHPPLGKLIIATGILVFGNDAFGWRVTSAIFGALGIVMLYWLGLTLTKRRSIAFLAAFLLLCDGLYFVYSRVGLVDIYVTVIGIAVLLAFSLYLTAPADRIRWQLFLTGALLGMGIATKWNAAYVAIGIGLAVLWRTGRLFLASRKPDAPAEVRDGLREHLLWIPLALGLVPAAIYVLSYAQFFLEGYSVSQFIQLQKEMFHVHSTIRDGNPMASRWWEWPLALRNVWFGTRTYSNGDLAVILANGNPILYWAFLPAIAWAVIRRWRTPNPILIVILIGFFAQWLPWIFIERSTFTYHFLPAVPFGCLAVAMAVMALFDNNTGWRRTLAVEYVVIVVLAFAFFYPIYAYYPISQDALALRMWLPWWRESMP